MRIGFRASVFTALIVMAGSRLWAQPAPAGGYRIAGRVIDAVTGEKVSRATVTVLSDDYKMVASMETDADGRFSFEHIAAGKYPLSAGKRGYRTSFYDQHDNFNSAIVTGEGQETGNLSFRLPPAPVLRGVVTGDGGDPVENAQVMLFKRPNGAENGGHKQQIANAQTDDTGAYEFDDIPSGEYYIAVEAAPWYAQRGRPVRSGTHEQSALDVAYPITFYDSTIDENSATPVTVSWGSRDEADINLHAVPAVRFTIPIERGRPDGPHVVLQQKIFGNTVNTQNSEIADGPANQTWDLPGLAPGNYEVELGHPPRRMTVNATSDVDLDPNAGTPLLSVAGTVVMEGGGSVPDDISLVLTSDEGDPPLQADVRRGQFQLNAIAPGTWTVAAGSPKQTLAVVATSVGGAMAAGDKIAIRDKLVQVKVLVSHAQTRVQGFARKDGKGVSGAMIVLVPKERSAYPSLARRDQSDSDGSFSLNDVPAGQYTVVAIEDGWKLDWQQREVIEPYLKAGVPVLVTADAPAVVKLAGPVLAVSAR